MVETSKRNKWPSRLDSFCAVMAGLVPTGVVIGNAGYESMVALVGLCWIARSIAAKENPLPRLAKHSLVIPWLAWFAVIIISLFLNGPGSKGWAHDFVMIRYFIFFAALLDISERKPVCRYLLTGLAGGIVWAGLNTLSAHVIGYDLIGKPLSRYVGKLKEPGRISSVAAYAGPFLIAWAMTDKAMPRQKRILWGAIGLLAFWEVFHFGIRTVFGASLVGIGFTFLYLIRKQAWLVIAVSTAACIAVWAILYYHITPDINMKSIYDRIYIWKMSWAMWGGKPLFGVGVAAWKAAFKELASTGTISYLAPDGSLWNKIEGHHSHNLFLMLTSATGIAGLATFSWLFFNAIYLVARGTDGWRIGLATWPVVFLVIGLTGWNIYASQYQVLFAFFMALTGSASHIAESKALIPNKENRCTI